MSLFIGSAGSPGGPPPSGSGGLGPFSATAPGRAAPPPTPPPPFTGTGPVHGEAAALEVAAVERGDGGLRLLVVAHFHEAETLGAPGVPIHDHLRGIHGSV